MTYEISASLRKSAASAEDHAVQGTIGGFVRSSRTDVPTTHFTVARFDVPKPPMGDRVSTIFDGTTRTVTLTEALPPRLSDFNDRRVEFEERRSPLLLNVRREGVEIG